VVEFDKLAADLMEVQSQMAFQEDTIAALNEALTHQQQEIIVLRRQVELLKQRWEEQNANTDHSQPPVLDERPPHY
jgi:SlyX protein